MRGEFTNENAHRRIGAFGFGTTFQLYMTKYDLVKNAPKEGGAEDEWGIPEGNKISQRDPALQGLFPPFSSWLPDCCGLK